MARTRRRMARPPRTRRRPRADWVYRPDLYDTSGGLLDGLGTYTGSSKSVGKGIENLSNFILYDSQNRLAGIANTAPNQWVQYPRAMRAEGKGPLILGCSGHIMASSTTWGIGNEFHLGLRAVVVEQDTASGNIYVAPTYSMWNISTFAPDQPAVFANSGNIAHEVRFSRRFSTGSEVSLFRIPFTFRTRRRLKPYQCFALIVEYTDYGLNVVGGGVRMWIRTLVSDEGHD